MATREELLREKLISEMTGENKAREMTIFGGGQKLQTVKVNTRDIKSLTNAYLALVQISSLFGLVGNESEDIYDMIVDLVDENKSLLRLKKNTVEVLSGKKVVKTIQLGNTKQSLSVAYLAISEVLAISETKGYNIGDISDAISGIINNMPESVRVVY